MISINNFQLSFREREVIDREYHDFYIKSGLTFHMNQYKYKIRVAVPLKYAEFIALMKNSFLTKHFGSVKEEIMYFSSHEHRFMIQAAWVNNEPCIVFFKKSVDFMGLFSPVKVEYLEISVRRNYPYWRNYDTLPLEVLLKILSSLKEDIGFSAVISH